MSMKYFGRIVITSVALKVMAVICLTLLIDVQMTWANSCRTNDDCPGGEECIRGVICTCNCREDCADLWPGFREACIVGCNLFCDPECLTAIDGKCQPLSAQEISGTRYLPLRITVIQNGGGVPATDLTRIKRHVRWANRVWAQANIQFYIREIRYLDDATLWEVGDDLADFPRLEQIGMSESSSIPVFYVNEGDTNLFITHVNWTGGSEPLLNLVILDSNAPQTTLAHELGHYFGLLHPFDGIEPLSNPDNNTPDNIMSYGIPRDARYRLTTQQIEKARSHIESYRLNHLDAIPRRGDRHIVANVLAGTFRTPDTPELYIRSDNYAGIIKYRRNTSNLELISLVHQHVKGKDSNNNNIAWTLKPYDTEFAIDVDGDGLEEILFRSPERVALARYENNSLKLLSFQEDWIGCWNLTLQDRLHIGDFDGDGKEEVYIRSPRYAGILKFDNRRKKFINTWISQKGGIDDGSHYWGFTFFDRETVGDFNGDNIDDIYIRNLNWHGLILGTKERDRLQGCEDNTSTGAERKLGLRPSHIVRISNAFSDGTELSLNVDGDANTEILSRSIPRGAGQHRWIIINFTPSPTDNNAFVDNITCPEGGLGLSGDETALILDMDRDSEDELLLSGNGRILVLDPGTVSLETRFDCVWRSETQIQNPTEHWSLGRFDEHLPWRINASARRVDPALIHRSGNYIGISEFHGAELRLSQIKQGTITGQSAHWNMGRLFPLFLDLR